jgi:hypothetical protein
MALTPHEQRALATIEDGLGADDPGPRDGPAPRPSGL